MRENALLNAAARFANAARQMEENNRDLRQVFDSLDAQSEAIATLRLQVYEGLGKGDKIAGGLQDFSNFMEKTTYEISDADRFGADSVIRAANEFADLVSKLANVAIIPGPGGYNPVGMAGQVNLESTGSLAWINSVIRS